MHCKLNYNKQQQLIVILRVREVWESLMFCESELLNAILGTSKLQMNYEQQSQVNKIP